ncbi:E3 ubiquitin-protein ligase TRIM71-like [Anneissia japonica]|uniref:E3 ubiquitin-protein ligase TRIM71-like n=1 Tax=Anneissia japonica TaxID=1529436 RepID=UPI001425B6D6|nr:E3 ubiquitin-protein ligase TRIM71-like [Anneissia japonica]
MLQIRLQTPHLSNYSSQEYFKMATSELNQFLENVDEKVLECTICFKRLQNPKSLNCLHSFCLACLEDWVMTKGKLTCPTCSKSYPLPEGGLQKLQPNTFLNNLLETIEQFLKRDQMKCICGKEGETKYYCQDCRQYLCSSCSDHHKEYQLFANHKLHSVEDMRSMNTIQIASLHPPQCYLHNEPLKLFCSVCNIPICMQCAITGHKEWDGKHKLIGISEAFETFKETSAKLEVAAHQCQFKLQDGLKAVMQNTITLEQSKDISLRAIDNHVQKMTEKIKENGEKMKNKVKATYKEKKEVNDKQIDELNTAISDINTKIIFLNQLLKSDEATVMQSSEKLVTALNDRTKELPKTEPNDNGHIYFFTNKQQMAALQQFDIGNVTHLRAADCLTLEGKESVSQQQTIVAKIKKTDECGISQEYFKMATSELNQFLENVDEKVLECTICFKRLQNPKSLNCLHSFCLACLEDWVMTKGKLTCPTCSKSYPLPAQKCTSLGVWKLNVLADGEPIKQSPLIVNVEKYGLVNTIQINKMYVRDVIKFEDDYFLVSCLTNEILKYKQSGECIGKYVTLPPGVKVYRMYKLKNDDIAFSDSGNKCIKVCNMNGQVTKSMGQGELKNPHGIHVNETSNVVYVTDSSCGWVFLFDIDSGQIIRKIGSPGKLEGQISGAIDVTFTNQGQLLVLEFNNNRLQLFDNEGRFIKVLVGTGDEDGKVRNPHGVVVDEDDNIIITSHHKLQLFSSDGNFLKIINNVKDGINNPWGLSVISYYPQRLVVANYGAGNVKIFNY